MSRNFCLSYFAGGGGASLGAKYLGYETLGVEFIPAIAKVYQQNIGEVVVGDVCKINPYELEVPSPDDRRRSGDKLIWQLSPPCQEDSGINSNGNPLSARGMILGEISWHLDIFQPDGIFLENVPNYANSKSGVFQKFCQLLIDKNYFVEWVIVDCADFGVPTNRNRLVLRARKREYGELPPLRKTHAKHAIEGQLNMLGEPAKAKWVSWYEAIKDLLPTLKPSKLTQKQKESIIKKGLKVKNGSFYSTLLDTKNYNFDRTLTARTQDEPAFTVITDTKIKAILIQRFGYSKLPQIRRNNLPAWTVLAGMSDDGKPNKLGRNGIRTKFMDCLINQGSRTNDIHEFLDNADVRSLNHLAIARFQSFPDDYIWDSDDLQINNKIIGNAVPSLLSFRVLESFEF